MRDLSPHSISPPARACGFASMPPVRAPNSKHGRSRARAHTPRACFSISVSSEARIGSRPVADGPGRRQSFCAQGPAAVVEWLEHARPSSPRILHVAELPDARVHSATWIRAVRSRGPRRRITFRRCVCRTCAAVQSSFWTRATCRRARRWGCCVSASLAVREFCVLARRAPSKGIRVMNAAEGRAAYGHADCRLPDPRMAQTIVDVERLLTRGRHAAAERALARSGRRIRAARRLSGAPVTPRSGSAGCCSAEDAPPMRRRCLPTRTIGFSAPAPPSLRSRRWCISASHRPISHN